MSPASCARESGEIKIAAPACGLSAMTKPARHCEERCDNAISSRLECDDDGT
jgi:hypothetical protein